MGLYIIQSDVEDVFGTTNTAKWSSLDGVRAADTDRIDKAIAWAEAFISAKLRRSVYAVPMVAKSSVMDPVLTNWIAVYAGHWLYMHRQIRANDDSDRTMKLIDMVTDELNMVLARTDELDLQFKESSEPTAPSHVW